MTGRLPDEGVNPVQFPGVLFDLWRWFLDLHSARGAGMGPSPITYLDLCAYSQLHRIRFNGWEMAALRWLDKIALAEDPMKA